MNLGPRPDDSPGDQLVTDPDLYKASASVPLEFNCDCDPEQGACSCEGM